MLTHVSLEMQNQAEELFMSWHTQGKRSRWWSTLFEHSQRLLSLSEVRKGLRVFASRYDGLRPVPLRQIRGSEGRCDDFDIYFRPLKPHNRDRWVQIAVARMKDIPLPPVALVQVNDIYYVRDGHHRISVAQLLGQTEIDAKVIIWSVSHGVQPSIPSARFCTTLAQPLYNCRACKAG